MPQPKLLAPAVVLAAEHPPGNKASIEIDFQTTWIWVSDFSTTSNTEESMKESDIHPGRLIEELLQKMPCNGVIEYIGPLYREVKLPRDGQKARELKQREIRVSG